MARSAAGVRHAGVPGPSPTTVSTPRARPIRHASIGDGASAIAHVARLDFVLGTRSVPRSPAAARAAASETPWQPTSRNTASDGFARRGVRTSRVGGSKNRAGSPSASASACTAGSSALRSTEKTPASDRADRPASASVCRTRSSSSLAATPRSQPTPSARCRRWYTRVSTSPESGASVTRTARAASAWNSIPERCSHSASPSRRHGSPASNRATNDL